MKGLSHTLGARVEPEPGSALDKALSPFPPLLPLPVTSAQGGSKNPLTFSSKIKSSGYGATKAFRPGWAVRSAARANGVESGESSALAYSPPTYPSLTPLMSKEYREVWGGLERVSASMRGVSVTSTGRVCISTSEGGERVASAPQSTRALAVGAVTSLAFSQCGTSLAASGTEGMMSASLGLRWEGGGEGGVEEVEGRGGRAMPQNWGVRLLGPVTRHETSPSLFSAPLCYSAAVYQNLVPKLTQVAPLASSMKPRGGEGGGSSSGGSSSSSSSRLVLGLLGGGRGVGVWAAGVNGPGASAPILEIDRLRGDMATSSLTRGTGTGSGGGGGGPSSSGAGAMGGPFPAPISSFCFAYLDRLVCVAAGQRIYIFKHSLGGEADSGSSSSSGSGSGSSGSSRRVAESRRFACVSSWEVEGGVGVLSLAALNEARSPYLFATCTDHTLRVFDLSAASGGCTSSTSTSTSTSTSSAATPPELLRCEAHSRAIHTLALPTASVQSSCATTPSSLDCVLTGSSEGGGLVRLWDMRSAQCSRQLSGGHVSRGVPTGAALSPCAIFCAVGSEEKRAVVYDLRATSGGGPGAGGGGCGVVSRLPGASETVTAVAWNPRIPLLAAGSQDGGVRLYVP